METMEEEQRAFPWRLQMGGYVDGVRWVGGDSWNPMLVVALWNADEGISHLSFSTLPLQQQHHSLPLASLTTHNTWPLPARTSVLKASSMASHTSLLASASYKGSISFSIIDLFEPSSPIQALHSSPLHNGSVSAMDLQPESKHCISVGEDGKINLVTLTDSSQIESKCLHDNEGLSSFRAVCWASPVEFVTAGFGFSLQWWDNRQPGAAVSHSSTKRISRGATGIIHSIDVHPSRKHVCVAGGSGGTVLAWDLRWQQEPIWLSSSILKGQFSSEALLQSDVWEVKYDPFTLLGGGGSGKVPPLMVCSEDGILAVLQGDENPVEVLAEPCAINTFDIGLENGSDLVCGLEYESLLYVRRPS